MSEKFVAHYAEVNSLCLDSPAGQFAYGLETLHDGRIRTLPSFDQDLNHQGQIPPLDASKYRSMAGIYLSDEVQMVLGEDACAVESFSFIPKDYLKLGRDNSRRQVFFGQLDIEAEGEVQSIDVAVKPFVPQDFHHATHEVGMLQYIDKKNLPTLDVLGIVMVPQGETPWSYAVTRFESKLATLENLNWRQMDESERWAQLRPAIDTMAALHAEAIFHGDYEFKNVGIGEEVRTTKIIDPEFAVSMREVLTPYANNPDERAAVVRKMSVDFGSLATSVRQYVCDPKTSEREDFDAMLDHVYAPYRAKLLRMEESPYQDVLLGALDEVVEKKRRQAYNEW
ncbi:MAG TPA: hypothetical protein VK983_01260 [Candidatus Limnocylindrales bacterium]|nr:hypothetical protein [Candidatus Limnocylindrales bacterium]